MRTVTVRTHRRHLPDKPRDPLLEETIDRLLAKHWPDDAELADFTPEENQVLRETW